MIALAVFISGVVGMTAQVLGLRQLTAVYQGNELTMGVMLASWLLWTSMGGLVGARLRFRKVYALGIAIGLQSVFLLVTLWFIRSSRGIIGIQPGQIVGLFPIVLSAIFTLAPVAFFTGLCFSISCQVWKSRRLLNIDGDNGAVGVQKVYVYEAIGAAVGGLLSFFLAPVIEPYPWTIIIGFVGLGAGVFALLSFSIIGRLSWGMIAILGIFVALAVGDRLENITLTPLFAGQDIIAKEESPYGQLTATGLAEQVTLYINGVKEANVPDPFAAEEVSHIPLALHPHPENVIQIGGIVGGAPSEILKHPMVKRLDLVELDPELIRMAGEVLPGELKEDFHRPEVTVWNRDGRRVLATSDETWDVILMDLPDPLSAQINRFYTLEWFQEVRRHLTDAGVFSFSVHSSENVVSPEQVQFLACIYGTLQQVIPYVVLLPGDNGRFIASPDSGVMQFDAMSVLKTLDKRGVEADYISEAYLPHLLLPYRVAQLVERIQQEDAPVNRDFLPVGYYTGLVLWDTHFRTSLKSVFQWLRGLSFWYVLAVMGGVMVLMFGISLYRRSRGESSRSMAVRTAIFTVGAAEIGIEILMILGFQVVFGVAYGWVAMIVTAFMVGLALGARLVPADRVGMRTFVVIQVCVVLVPVVMWLMVIQSRALMGFPPWVGGVLFGIGAMVAGGLGGAQFPVATALLVNRDGSKKSSARIGGGLYALDLLGSSLGALVISAFVVPLWGLGGAFVLLGLLNVVPLVIIGKQ